MNPVIIRRNSMNPAWLFLIIPVSVFFGYFLCALMVMASKPMPEQGDE